MRIAISCSHLVGKTTLAKALAEALPRYDLVPVPRSQARLRAKVDVVLRDIIADDAYGLKLDVITAVGTPSARLRHVVSHLRSSGT
jgi:hypothetical protein